jgi:hypothetical protein
MKYNCEKCVYSTDIKHHYEHHLLSKKHNEVLNKNKKIYTCKNCHKVYKSITGIKNHTKVCIQITETTNIEQEQISESTQNIIIETIKQQNNELIEKMKKEQNEMMETMMKKIEFLSQNQKPITINNITILNILKNNYNDVIPFEDFIEKMNIRYDDVKGIRDKYSCIECLKDLMVKKLKEYKITERPFHCIMDEDKNTETFLKNNEWIQEFVKDYDDKTPVLDTKISKFIKKVNNQMDNILADCDFRTNIKSNLISMIEPENIAEIKTSLFYDVTMNKYELNHNLLDISNC